jgi:hypothetical protein
MAARCAEHARALGHGRSRAARVRRDRRFSAGAWHRRRDQPNDLAIDADQVVLLGFDAFVDLVDLRERFAPLRVPAPTLDSGETFVTSKIACDGHGNRWLLDRRHRRIARLRGRALRTRAFVDFDPDTFRPCPENADAPRIEPIDLELPADTDFVLMATSRAGRVLVAGWGPDGRFMIHALEDEAARFVLGESIELEGAAHGHSIKWLDEAVVALRAGALDEALAYAVDSPDRPLQIVGARYRCGALSARCCSRRTGRRTIHASPSHCRRLPSHPQPAWCRFHGARCAAKGAQPAA